MELATTLAGLPLEHPLMNGAGTCKHLEDVKKLARSASAAIVVGSITLEPRDGNGGDTYYYDSSRLYSLHSRGLPCRGAQYYKENLPEMVRIAHDAGKPLIVSVAGFTPEEYGILTEIAFEGGADLVEENLGCPNIWKGSEQKHIACFDHAMVEAIHCAVIERVGVDARVADKLSPHSDPFALASFVKIAIDSRIVKVVTTTNTFANAFDFNEKGKPRITPGGGLAGFAGPAMKPIGLGQVLQLWERLPAHIQVVGVGGITYGHDVLEYLECGAIATQIATAYIEHGEQVFSSLLAEIVEDEEITHQ